MRIENQTIFVGDETARARQNGHTGSQRAEGQNRDSIGIRAVRAKLDPVAAKKQQAQKKALKVVGDVFANDKKVDDDLEGRRQRIAALREEIGTNRKAIRSIEEDREALRKAYGVDADSQEEKDLQLLAKEADARVKGSDVTLTEEESEKLARIKAQGLTEYQQRSMEMKEFEKPYAEQINEAYDEIKTENAIIEGTKLERLKSHAMADAQREAQSIMDAASREIVGMLVDEGREHIDEELEEKKEAAKEQEQEREELEEKIEAARDRRKEQQEFAEDILEAVEERNSSANSLSSAQQEIKDIMNKMKLIEDDIKGAAVDENI